MFKPHVTSVLAIPHDDVLNNRITQTGAKIKVQWTREETESTGWKAGWYVATVHSYCMETDVITLTYQSEPNHPYNEELTPLITQRKLKLIWSPL